jgi:hypothetical protein
MMHLVIGLIVALLLFLGLLKVAFAYWDML